MKTKKIIVSFVLICVCSLSTLAYDFAAGSDVYLYYNKIGDSSVEVTNKVPNHAIDSLSKENIEVTLRYHNLYVGDIVIPSTVTHEGKVYTVRSIGDAAFAFSDLASVTIPATVTNIGAAAFVNCDALTSISIPNSVTHIGESAFEDCSALSSVSIGNGVAVINHRTFYRCAALTSIIIPNSVTSIIESAFGQCAALTSVTIGSGVTNIGKWVFCGCRSLKTMVVRNGNTMYDSRNNCNAIIETGSNTLIAGCQNTVIPNGVTNIGLYAFDDRKGLTSITIPASVRSIDWWAFNGCDALDTVVCYATTPPNWSNSFDTDINIYVPCEALEAYKTHKDWKRYTNIRCISDMNKEVVAAVVEEIMVEETVVEEVIQVVEEEAVAEAVEVAVEVAMNEEKEATVVEKVIEVVEEVVEEVAEEVIMNAPTIPARPVIAVGSERRFTQISSAPESPAIVGEQPASIGSEMKKTSSKWEEYKTIQAGLKR